MQTSVNFKAVLFDLDGTLLDTLEDLADSMNAVLRAMGFPVHPMESYRYFVGDGIEVLARRSLPQADLTEELVRDCVRLMRLEYGSHWAVKTVPYGGIVETLERLRHKEVVLAVLSNKPHAMTERVVERFFPEQPFAAVWGARQEVARKPSPEGALAVAAELGLPPARFLYLGDTAVDMRTAKGAGMHALGAAWGFRTVDELVESGADLVISHPLEVMEFFT